MDRLLQLRPATWPWLIVILCVLVGTGCQDGTGPGLVTSPDEQSAAQGKPPQPPPPPADPAIVFNGEVEREQGLYVMNADGSNVTRILTEGFRFGWSWSPRGDAIALDGDLGDGRGIYRINIHVVDGVPTAMDATLLVADTVNSGVYRPAWSPVVPWWSSNGEQIVYTRYATGGEPHDLRRIEAVPAEGGDPVILYTSESGGAVDDAIWNRDATQIAFTEASLTSLSYKSIRILDVPSGVATTVLDLSWSQGVDGGPWDLDWARTQDALVFRAGPSGRNGYGAVYVMQKLAQPQTWGEPTFVVGGVRREEATTPTWSPDDSEILFSRDWGELQKINLGTGEVTRLGVNGKFPDWRRF